MRTCDYCDDALSAPSLTLEFSASHKLNFCGDACMYGWRDEYYALTDCACCDWMIENAIDEAINE